MATVIFFGSPKNNNVFENKEEKSGKEEAVSEDFGIGREYLYQNSLEDHPNQWALLQFESPVYCNAGSMIICSKLDTDITANTCRLAFYGKVEHIVDYTKREELSKLKLYRIKEKEGSIDRIADEYTLIGKDLFKKETDMSLFVGLKIKKLSDGEIGVIECPFGKSGKFKVRFQSGNLQKEQSQGKLLLQYKRFYFTENKKLAQ
eukprot:TRINITY_DN5133_c0_g1_i2.p1 TRINITY_DN5133_c0_g1~~TRINITY_DN5133_c0_g1_i2.p1  ORF type:complete len:204 (+),score=55.15 TRINITY_DN5133_c0_g1_i2:214-825(+)